MSIHRWSLITVTYNSADALSRFWADFRPNDEVEWIVVDNASSDRSPDIAESFGADVIRLRRNSGFGRANNIAFEQSLGRYVAFVNPDVRVSLGGLQALQRAIEAEPTSLVGPQLLNPNGTLQPNGRGLPYLSHKIVNRMSPDKLHGTYLHFANPGEAKEVSWLMGAAVAASRERFELLGPWDERYFVYYEDSDIGLRNRRFGGRSLLIGDARWTHGWARETKTPSASAWRREIASMAKFYTRYPKLLLSAPPTIGNHNSQQ